MPSGRRGAWMNGNRKWARELSSVLERLTSRSRLDRLTMLPPHRILPAPRVLGARRRWCRHCYRAMREETSECWDPLIWSLAPVVWCAVHGERLCSACPSCACSQPWLPHDTSLGWFAWCGADLVEGRPEGFASENINSESVSARERRAAAVCTDMATSVGEGGGPARPERLGIGSAACSSFSTKVTSPRLRGALASRCLRRGTGCEPGWSDWTAFYGSAGVPEFTRWIWC